MIGKYKVLVRPEGWEGNKKRNFSVVNSVLFTKATMHSGFVFNNRKNIGRMYRWNVDLSR
jgi:hypothetical protein